MFELDVIVVERSAEAAVKAIVDEGEAPLIAVGFDKAAEAIVDVVEGVGCGFLYGVSSFIVIKGGGGCGL